MSLKHISQVPKFIKDDKGRDILRRAIAPYNFVELPNKIVEAEELQSGDRYYPDHHTGKIECTLTTESPLYIRCGLTTEEFQAGKEAKDLPDFFYTDPATKSEKPVLPGSSIRGMLRTLVEIVSFSKIDRVSGEHRLFFRAVAANKTKESWGKEYKKYVDPEKVLAGYLKKDAQDAQSWYIQPAIKNKGVAFAWVQEDELTEIPEFKKFDDDGYKPQYFNVSYQSLEKREERRNGKVIAQRWFAQNINLQETEPRSKLVTSGNLKQGEGSESSPRCNHCIVFAENKNADRLQIDDTAIEHYRNALTDFQKEPPFNKDWGVLEENRPVFYSPPKNGSKTIGFFGQSPNFRIPYSPQGDGHATTVVDFIPEKLRQLATIDLADAIFGWVKQESKEKKLPKGFEKQRAGRVFVTDALYKSNQKGIWYEDKPFSPQVLSEPKPTCFPHYLVQPEENNPNADPSKLKHYASQPVAETVIRGHKLYWHQSSDPNFKLAPPKKVIGSPKKASDTQTTLIKPINRGVVFTFDIHFENLSKVELGALLWVLSLSNNEKSQKLETGKSDEEYCFSLGMGKPLGMGAVKIDYNLHLSKRNERYSRLFNDAQWKTGEEDQSQTAKEEGESVKAFEEYVLDRICCQDYPINKKREQLQHLKELPRIEMLLAMLQCNIPDVDKTRYMRIEPKPSEYTERPVLPTPLDIRRIPDNRTFLDVNPSSGGTVENKSIDNPKKKVIYSKPKPKPKPKNKSNPDMPKGGDSTNRATQRPPKPKN